MPPRGVQIDDHYSDPASPGRIVKVVGIDATGVTVETVRAADDAVTHRAVGRVTHLSRSTLSKFHFEPTPVLD